MKLLLDISGDSRLPAKMKASIRDIEVYLSVVSVWEAIIKHQLGKLPLPQPPEVYLPEQRRRHLIISLGVNEESVVRLAGLPPLHRDPFDRLLIARAAVEKMSVISIDTAFDAYPITRLW